MASTSLPVTPLPRTPRRPGPRRVSAASAPPTSSAPPLNLWTTERTAEYLGVTRQTIYHWRVAGYGPVAIRYRGGLRFRPEDVTAWVALQQEQGR